MRNANRPTFSAGRFFIFFQHNGRGVSASTAHLPEFVDWVRGSGDFYFIVRALNLPV